MNQAESHPGQQAGQTEPELPKDLADNATFTADELAQQAMEGGLDLGHRLNEAEAKLAEMQDAFLRAKADAIELEKADASGCSADAPPKHDVADVGQKQTSAFFGKRNREEAIGDAVDGDGAAMSGQDVVHEGDRAAKRTEV